MTDTDDSARNQNGTFAKGNRFWEARSSHGRTPKFETAAQLEDACEQYFDYVADNPMKADNLVTFQGSATHEETSLMRAMTLDGLTLFIGVSRDAWESWRIGRPDLIGIITRVESIIRTQKFEGAAAGLLNANIIARDLGLREKQDVDLKHTSVLDGDELDKRILDLLGGGEPAS